MNRLCGAGTGAETLDVAHKRTIHWMLAALVACLALFSTTPAFAAGGSGSIAGTVTEFAGAKVPLKGVLVTVYTEKGALAGSAKTGASGEYKVEKLTAGNYKVEFSAEGFATQYYKEVSLLGLPTAVAVSEGVETKSINAALKEAGKISGKVVEPGGKPLAGVGVSVYGLKGEGAEPAITNSEGKYEITGLQDGEYKVEFLPVGNFVPQFYENKNSFASATPVVVSEEHTTPVNVTLQVGAKVEGRVTDAATYLPIAHVFVTAINANPLVGFLFPSFGETNANGEYSVVGLETGTYSLEFESSEEPGTVKYIRKIINGVGAVQEKTTPLNVALVRKEPVNTAAPVASGTPAVGQTLTCSNGSWTGSATLKFTYAWLRDGSAIAGASANTYVVQAADQGHGLACQVTATNSFSHTSATSNTLSVPAPPPPAPTISNVSQSHSSWREGSKSATFSRKQPPVGTTYSFTLNEQASVSFAFTQRLGGRKVKGKCVAPTGKNRHKPTCKRTVTQGRLSFGGHAGLNKVSFQGRIPGAKKLGLGSYTLLVSATNAAGHATAPPLNFAIVK